MANKKNDTQTFDKAQNRECRQILEQVYSALKEKGYNPVEQLIGYMMSEDPTYITSSKGARSNITQVSRYDLLREIVSFYIESLEGEDDKK